VFVRKDVHAQRGPFSPPSSYAVQGTLTPVRMLLDPISEVAPDVDDGLKWNVLGRAHDPDHVGPKLYASAGSGNSRRRAYDIDGPCQCLTTGISYCYDSRLSPPSGSSLFHWRAPPHPRIASTAC
jgi:hypothetical protein